MGTEKTLKILLWIVAVYHILLGILGIFAKETAVLIANSFFNFNLTLTDEMLWIINPFSAYLLFFGVFMAVVASDPKKYKKLVYAGVGLFALRVVQRVIFLFYAPASLIYNVDPLRNVIAMAVVAVIGVWMYVLARKLK